ncbi:aminoacyl-tRNA hydrolase [Aspergillus nanangensis]|uniref:Aminoacyl-tRNA hydrolase n=1 Tax=Aspergillus nanangensis TaxID=2582783 RepID=A0AAD4CD48_ASPNN|nr:aminoacyl-tRNA hydrolase [Aspergillus nanangensis]
MAATKTISIPHLKTPRRFIFIASIGNPKPYRTTRHSAGHLLLDALIPQLLPRVPLVPATSQGKKGSSSDAIFFKTWHSPSLMNVSGRKLVRELQRWLATTQTETLPQVVQPGQIAVIDVDADADTIENNNNKKKKKSSWLRRGVDPHHLHHVEPTLVILHDELEAPLGKVRMKRGGAESASLRGHRGLISIMEQLQAKKLYPPRAAAAAATTRDAQPVGGLAVLRIGVGIGRPQSREKGSVADYVLTEMNAHELAAVRAAAGTVLDILEDELYREADPVTSS